MSATKNPTPDATDPAAEPAGKGRPTPRRKDVEAQRRRPLVPGDRKGAAKAARARSREIRDREFEAMKTGDEKNMPLRDRGPIKRFIRDFIDARWSFGEFFLPIAIVFVFLTALSGQNAAFALAILFGLWGVIVATVLQAWLTSRKLRKGLEAKFGDAGLAKGNLMYGIMRSLQIRRSRLPRPVVKRGEHPNTARR